MQTQQEPEPFDPRIVDRTIAAVTKELDELQSEEAPVPRKLHDIIQDRMMPVLAQIQSEVSTLAYFMSAHEDRIIDLEEDTGSQLAPEDGSALLAYLEQTVVIVDALHDKNPKDGLDKLADTGREMAEFVRAITLPEEPEDQRG